MRTGGWVSRWSTGAAVVAVGVLAVQGATAAGRASSRGRDRADVAAARGPERRACETTRIHGVTVNRTDNPIVVTQVGEGLTTEWCREPSDDVAAHESHSWTAGDDVGDVEINIGYQLHNTDRILFFAHVRKGGQTDTGCAFTHVVSTRRDYECKTEIALAGSGLAFVRFIVATRNP
jgi:hypothetical protein